MSINSDHPVYQSPFDGVNWNQSIWSGSEEMDNKVFTYDNIEVFKRTKGNERKNRDARNNDNPNPQLQLYCDTYI
jgi:hypothetical protein